MPNPTSEVDMSDSPQNIYGSGVASLIGNTEISLDGQSVQIPDDSVYDTQDDNVSESDPVRGDSVYDTQDNNISKSVQIPDDSVYDDMMQDDVSSINDYSYYRGLGGPPQIKIIGTAESMEAGNVELMSPSSIALTNEGDGITGQTLSKQNNLSLGDSQKKLPDMKNTSKLSVYSKQRRGWMPKWVDTAPTWLKCFIIVSMALLIGAVVLVTVALTTALANETSTSSATVDSPSSSTPNDNVLVSSPEPTSPTGTLPYETYIGMTDDLADDDGSNIEDTVADSITSSPTMAPTKVVVNQVPSSAVTDTTELTPYTTDANGGEQPIDEADDGVTHVPTAESPASTPTEQGGSGVDSANNLPSAQYDPYVTTFFVTGGRFTNDGMTLLPSQLQSMPVRGGTSFLVHLGDWNSPYATRCDKQSYADVSNLFSNSSVPVYFIPGDNDYNGAYCWGITCVFFGGPFARALCN
jgi:hypothetical protein